MWSYFGLDELFSNRSSTTAPTNVLTQAQQAQRKIDLDTVRNNYTYVRDLTEEHYNTIKELKSDEESRLNSIENKLAQIITQSGLIFSLTSLLAPIFKDSLGDLSLPIKVTIIICFIASFLSFLFSILIASKIYRIHNFVYVRQNRASIIETPPNDEKVFLVANVKHLISEISHNREINNIKANLLIYANRLLITGFISSGLLSLVLCSFLLFGENKDYKQENLALEIKRQDAEIASLKRSYDNMKKLSLNISDSTIRSTIQKNISILEKKINSLDRKESKMKKLN